MSDDYQDWKELLDLLKIWADLKEGSGARGSYGYMDALEIKYSLEVCLVPPREVDDTIDPATPDAFAIQRNQLRADVVDMLKQDLDTDPNELYQVLENAPNIFLPTNNTTVFPLAEFGEWIADGEVEAIEWDCEQERIHNGKVVKLN